MKNNYNQDTLLDREKLIEHAKIVLSCKLTQRELSEEVGVHVRQIGFYRNGSRPIENAYLETLIKFEHVYQTNPLFEKNRNQEAEGTK